MIGKDPQITNPPFERAYRGTVNDEGLRGSIISSSRLQVLHIGSVAELGLGVAPEDLSPFRGLQEHLLLFVSAEVPQRDHEHGVVEAQRRLFVEEDALQSLVFGGAAEQLVKPDELLGHVLHDLLAGELDVLGVVSQNRVVAHDLLHLQELVQSLGAPVHQVGQLCDVERHLFSLFLEHFNIDDVISS